MSVENPTFAINGKFEMTAANTNFTGGITVLGPQITHLTITDETNLGGNPPAFRADQLHLNQTGILAVATSVTLDDPNRGITLTAAGSMNVASGKTLTVACPITGTGALYKHGTGTLVLSGDNNYTGGTVINTGTLEAHSADALGDGSLTFESSTTCKVLVDASGMPFGARVADLLGTTIQVQPIFTTGLVIGVEIPLFLLTADAPTVTANDITLTGVPSGYEAEVESKIVDDGGTPRTLLYTKYIVPGTIIMVQ
jgi:autotransporter-associated beta strand protein